MEKHPLRTIFFFPLSLLVAHNPNAQDAHLPRTHDAAEEKYVVPEFCHQNWKRGMFQENLQGLSSRSQEGDWHH